METLARPAPAAAERMAGRLSRRIREVPPSGIRRFFEIAATMDDVISLGIGEPDFVSPQPIIDAAKTALDAGRTSYTANLGLAELREAISGEMARLYGLDYHAEDEVIVTVGASEAMTIAMLSLLDPGDEVLIPEPCFVSYGPLAEFAGGVVKWVPTRAENDFQVTAEDIRSRITDKTKLLFLGYPNNPTGAVLRRDVLEEIAEVVVEHDLLVLSDEIYDRLVYGEAHEDGHVSVPTLPGLFERTILIGGFSKGYAMTGWRIGYACAPQPILYQMYKAHQYVIMSAPTVSQVGALAGIRDAQPAVEDMRRAYDDRRRVIVDGLRAAGFPTFEPEGAFYAFPDITSTGLSSEDFAQRLLQEEHVAAVPGSAFGPSGEGYLRCSYATAIDQIEEAIHRITAFADRVRNE
ncbi:aminotransferase class I/II-fold pyridoxal phosphate-dependent enzyme [Rubrivirga sp. S365]|uniref:pyridoxal phosphate-dependent aminotransferase n=1 Tax=Rubrivirga sp. S365 TaxID=3076080 RepID=UPI0028C648CE|nr:aminotransferase class I/II-fold pyridoxal phosphate-dependent enzyme [Rubrivirga sp. S365]MDT7856900.1 aminotransferase class I/II-fold pyridoxal phosphate-dependent enzyme [Rubrivirga sp. S365]